MNSDGRNAFISVLVCLFLSLEVFVAMMDAGALFEPNVVVNEGIVKSFALEQEDPSIAVDSSGNIYIVWVDIRAENSHKIYFASSTDGGHTFSTNKKVCDGVPGSQQCPSIAVDDIGNVYIVWSDNRFGSNFNIYFTNSTDGGNTFCTSKKVNVGDAGGVSALATTIAADSVGNVYIAWEDFRNGDYDIYFANSTDGGHTFAADQRVNDDIGSTLQDEPSIALDDAGNVYIAWEDFRSGSSDIYFTDSTDGGQTFSPNIKVNDDGVGAGQWPPSVEAYGVGNVYITWTDFRNERPDIYFANSTDGGHTFSNNKKVNDGGVLHHDPCIAADDTGNIYITWEDQRNGGDNIYFANSTDGGHTFSPNKQVNDDIGSTEQYDPSIVAYGTANISIVWTDERGGNPDIYFSGSFDGGNTFSPNKRINDDIGSAWQHEPSIAVDSTGDIFVTWMDDRNGNYLDWDIYFASSIDGGHTFSTDKKVNNDSGSSLQCDPSIAVDNAGNIYIAWTDEREGNPDVYFANSTDGGSTFHGNIKVNNDPGEASQREPSIAVDNGGNIYIAWTDEREGNPDIYFANSIDGGYTFSTNNKVSDDTGNAVQDEPSIAVDNAGNIFIAWTDERGGNPDIYFMNSTDGGYAFSPNKKVNDDTGNAVQDEPAIAANGAFNIFIAWTDERNGHPDIYFANSTDGGYGFSPNKKVNDDADNTVQDQPTIAADNTGNAYVAWRDDRNDVPDIYFTLTAFRIFDIQVLDITDTTATITWESNRPADSNIDYSFSPAYLYSIQNSSKVTLHRMELTNLEPGRLYHFKVTSYNRSTVYTTSRDFTFTTKYPIPLDSGWNMISLPLNQTDTTLSKVLENISGQYDAVQWYDANNPIDPWKYHNTAKPPFLNDLTCINQYMALWVHMKNATTLYVDGTAPEMWQVNSVPLVKGWNFVGYPSLIERGPPFGLPPGIDAVHWYNTTSGLWESWDRGTNCDPDTLRLMRPGQGFWIHYSGSQTDWELEYFASNIIGEFVYTQDGSSCSVQFVRMYENNEIFITEVTSAEVLAATSAHSGKPILIRDDFGKYILAYKDSSYVIKLAYCNANPLEKTSWVTNITICDGVDQNAFLTNLSSLHIVYHAKPIGSPPDRISAYEVNIVRDENGSIVNITVGAQTVLDGDDRAKGVRGVLTHNKNIVAVWSIDTKSTIPSTSFVRSMRYIPGIGWRNMNGTSTDPDQITPDFQPGCAPFNYLAITQHPANSDLYVLQQHDSNNFYRLIKAIWNESSCYWEWQPLIEDFITEEDGANGDHSRPVIFQDPLLGKLVVPSQSKYNGLWDAEAGIWFSSLRIVSIDENDIKTHLGDAELDNLPRGTARGQIIVVPDKSGCYYLIYPTGVKQGRQGNLNLIIWNGTSWSSSSKVIDPLGFYPSAAAGNPP